MLIDGLSGRHQALENHQSRIGAIYGATTLSPTLVWGNHMILPE
jgi:hypothetical protein